MVFAKKGRLILPVMVCLLLISACENPFFLTAEFPGVQRLVPGTVKQLYDSGSPSPLQFSFTGILAGGGSETITQDDTERYSLSGLSRSWNSLEPGIYQITVKVDSVQYTFPVVFYSFSSTGLPLEEESSNDIQLSNGVVPVRYSYARLSGGGFSEVSSTLEDTGSGTGTHIPAQETGCYIIFIWNAEKLLTGFVIERT